MLAKFLYRHLKGYRLFVVLGILMTLLQVGADILAAMPLKFITSKISNPASDPACTFGYLDSILTWFDNPNLDISLQPGPGETMAKVPPTLACPNAAAHADKQFSLFPGPSTPLATHHSILGVLALSIVLLVFFNIFSAFITYISRMIASFIAQNLSARLRNQLFEHLQRLSLDWHGKHKKGDLVQRITGNIGDVEKLISDGLIDLLSSVLTLIGVALIMWSISPAYTLLSMSISPVLFMLVLIYTRKIKASSKKTAKTAGQVANVATEDINALTVIKVFTREERENARFGNYVNKNRQSALRTQGLQAQFSPLVSILVATGTALIVGVGGFVAAGNTFNFGPIHLDSTSGVDIGTLILFLTYLKMLYQPMRDLSKLTNVATAASSGAERIQEVFDQAPEIMESIQPYDGPEKLQGEISFEDVHFGYTSDRSVLKGVTLHIPAGRRVALVGLSGGGKTTLVKLIPRFYEITDGTIKVDGRDNRNYPLKLLRQNVSMVLQDSVLFEGTIRDNIEVGRPGASFEDIVEAAKKANIHDSILDILGGYDRLVREQGKDLSGGQRQRIAIARAILRDAPILILDEPTAALDVEAEAEVMRALDTLIVGRTVLMISHRLSTLGHVDEVIVLKDGQIVEQGTYEDLKHLDGVFARLLAEQNRYNMENIAHKSIIRSIFPPTDANMVFPSLSSPEVIKHMSDQRANRKKQPSRQAITPIEPVFSLPSGKTAQVQVEIEGKILGTFLLNKPVIMIGRLAGNDIHIPHQRVSRLHAKILLEEGNWQIEDADSVNGLFFEGKQIERHPLKEGERIQIAPAVFLEFQTIVEDGIIVQAVQPDPLIQH